MSGGLVTLRALLVGALVVVAGAGHARADALSDGVGTIPGAVEDVRIAGTWDLSGESGVYRLVVARTGGDPVTARLFVQWVAYAADGGSKLEHSVEIKEFTNLGVDIDDLTYQSDRSGLSVTIRTLDPNGTDDRTYQLQVTSPTDYRLAPASN